MSSDRRVTGASAECGPYPREVEMRKQVLILTTTASILTCGPIAASGQALGARTPTAQQNPMIQPTPGPMLEQQNQMDRALEGLQNRAEEEEEDLLKMLD
jgi:hypothetical protein